MRRAVDAVSAGTEIDAVEIKFEDLFLRQRFFQLRRIHHVGQLARNIAPGIGEDDLGGLLRDGRTARHPAPRLEIGPKRAQQALRIDAVMRIETPVFHGDEGGGQISRHLLQRQPLADNGAAMAGNLAFGIEEGEGDGPVHRI